ncbi:uncharacterized protein LOC130647083 [Hydractinia symbiolongicarpus]|uniref:uncharacterized protein LOC130647083 n=1 Tax=Hydractinia symbiolongicarpus TaxID=13093 RepID=UPI00254C9180|nr:uncharacterized protein LOC130647083 [Hydractinia symbiolongicarpus]
MWLVQKSKKMTRFVVFYMISQVFIGQYIVNSVLLNGKEEIRIRDVLKVSVRSPKHEDGTDYRAPSSILAAVKSCYLQDDSICQIDDNVDNRFRSTITIDVEYTNNRMQMTGIGFSQKTIPSQDRIRRSLTERPIRIKVRVRRSGQVVIHKKKVNKTSKIELLETHNLKKTNGTNGKNTSGNRYVKLCKVGGVWVTCLGIYTPRPTTTCRKGFICLGNFTAAKFKIPDRNTVKKSSNRRRRHTDKFNIYFERTSQLTVKKCLKYFIAGLESTTS